MMIKQEHETQEFTATRRRHTRHFFVGYCIGLILSIPALILYSLGRNTIAAASCPNRPSQLIDAGLTVYLVEIGIVLFFILGSVFWQETTHSYFLVVKFGFGLFLGFLTILIPCFFIWLSIPFCFNLVG